MNPRNIACLLMLTLPVTAPHASAGFLASEAGGVVTELALDALKKKTSSSTQNGQTAQATQKYSVEAVLDGDTIAVRSADGRTSYRVRLAMIDAPEKQQDYGMSSKASLTQLLRGSANISIESFGHDAYGRMIGIVFDERQRNVNLLQLENGAAWLYSLYAEKPAFAGYVQSFKAAEQRARMQKIGLWSNPSPTPPWKFRRG